nr:hypothetical protein [Afipia clevelandensis]
MSTQTAPIPEEESERIDAATDQAIAACDGDARAAVRALIIANDFLEYELRMKVSHGYVHRRFKCYSG